MPERDTAPIVVLTTLDLEYRAMRAHLTGLRRINQPPDTRFEVGYLPGLPTRIALAQTGTGTASTAVLAARAIQALDPRALVFVGVAGALRDDLKLGDVVVATRVYAPHRGKDVDGRFLAHPRAFETSHELLDLAEHLNAIREWSEPEPGGAPVAFRVHFEPIAAGDVVLNSRDAPLGRQLRGHYNDAVAIEMESAGIARTGYLSNAVPSLTVRGISDTADGRKSPNAGAWQSDAAAHAAIVAAAVLQEWIATSLTPVGSDVAVGGPPTAVRAPTPRAASGSTLAQVASIAERLEQPQSRGGVLRAFASGFGAVFDLIDLTGVAGSPGRRRAPILTWRDLIDVVDACSEDET